jgi:hypothetical protein
MSWEVITQWIGWHHYITNTCWAWLALVRARHARGTDGEFQNYHAFMDHKNRFRSHPHQCNCQAPPTAKPSQRNSLGSNSWEVHGGGGWPIRMRADRPLWGVSVVYCVRADGWKRRRRWKEGVGVLDRQTYQGGTRGSWLCGGGLWSEHWELKGMRKDTGHKIYTSSGRQGGEPYVLFGVSSMAPSAWCWVVQGVRLGTQPSFI